MKISKEPIKIVLLDIDGVLTDGKVTIDSSGKELKKLDFKDLDGAFEIKRMGMKLGFITKEATEITNFFKERFQPDIFFNGTANKLQAIDQICAEHGVTRANICYVGDGKYDAEGVASVGLGACPQNAIPQVKEVARIVLTKDGGDGCVWELVTHLKTLGEEAPVMEGLFEHLEVFHAMKRDKAFQDNVVTVANCITSAYKNGGKVYLAGNGGSASDAQHIATEFLSRFYFNRPSLDAECLAGNLSALTALGNDYGFDTIFSRQLSGKATEKDVFIGLSTSGKSKNILEALRVAKEKGATTITMIGETVPIDVANFSDYVIAVPSSVTPRIQEAHIFVGHLICQIVERDLFGAEYGK